MRIELEEKYRIQSNVLDNTKYSKSYFPIVPAIIKIPGTDITSYPFSESFIFDSGASISVIHQRNRKLFKDIKPIDTTPITFGNSSAHLDVYKVILRIQGYDFELVAALAKDLRINYSLIGYYKGYELFDMIVLNNKLGKLKLINKYGV